MHELLILKQIEDVPAPMQSVSQLENFKIIANEFFLTLSQ